MKSNDFLKKQKRESIQSEELFFGGELLSHNYFKFSHFAGCRNAVLLYRVYKRETRRKNRVRATMAIALCSFVCFSFTNEEILKKKKNSLILKIQLKQMSGNWRVGSERVLSNKSDIFHMHTSSSQKNWQHLK